MANAYKKFISFDQEIQSKTNTRTFHFSQTGTAPVALRKDLQALLDQIIPNLDAENYEAAYKIVVGVGAAALALTPPVEIANHYDNFEITSNVEIYNIEPTLGEIVSDSTHGALPITNTTDEMIPLVVISNDGPGDVPLISTLKELVDLLNSHKEYVQKNNLGETEYLTTVIKIFDYLHRTASPDSPLYSTAQRALEIRKSTLAEALTKKDQGSIQRIQELYEYAKTTNDSAVTSFLEDGRIKTAYELTQNPSVDVL